MAHATVSQVPVAPVSLDRLRTVLLPAQQRELDRIIDRGQALLGGRVVWNVNSTAYGGGVAEMLWSLVGYARSAEVDARWMVVAFEPDFSAFTKGLHNRLQA
jgi:trehalose synthase